MPSTPSHASQFDVHPIPRLPSPLGARPRDSISASFSYGPQRLVDSFMSSSATGASHRRRSRALDPNRSILQVSPRASPRHQKRIKDSAGRHPLANDNTDVFEEEGDDDDYESDVEWTMLDRMRLWRHDALMQHLYDTSAFWGDKILSWTSDPNDAFWLAQTYFLTHQYSRAETLLTRPFPTGSDNRATQELPFLNGHAHSAPNFNFTSFAQPSHMAHGNTKGKGKEKEHIDPATLGRLPVGPGAMIEVAARQRTGISRLVDMSVACRYLAAQCQMRQGKWEDALEMLGDTNPFKESGRSGPAIPNIDGGIKVEATMCHLRGLLMLKTNRNEKAKVCFMEALALDVKCYDSFQQLISGELLSPAEEWALVQGLAYKEQTPEDAEFVRMMYTSRLRKYKHAEEHALIRRKLVDEFGLSDNPDVMFSFADALYAQFRWADCFAITTRILGLVSVHAPTMPLHIACMHHLSHLRSKLFILAHDMVEKEPENPISWYAVGVWYMTAEKHSDARTYFSKTSLMDPRFGPAWIAFAHTFAFEGEHDHAVTAYSTCARMYSGSHLPLLFVGMEHILLSNYEQADEALNAANQICDEDPLLLNERGVMAFNRGNFDLAAELFKKAIDLARVSQNSQEVWVSTYMNLGTSCRKLGRLEDAKAAYEQVIEIDPRSATAFAFLGMVQQLMGNADEAILRYHEALSIEPINGFVLELLNLALEINVDVSGPLNTKKSPLQNGWAMRMKDLKDKGKQVVDIGVSAETYSDVAEEQMKIG